MAVEPGPYPDHITGLNVMIGWVQPDPDPRGRLFGCQTRHLPNRHDNPGSLKGRLDGFHLAFDRGKGKRPVQDICGDIMGPPLGHHETERKCERAQKPDPQQPA